MTPGGPHDGDCVLTAVEIAVRLGVTRRDVNRRAREERWPYEQFPASGKRRYYRPERLPEAVRAGLGPVGGEPAEPAVESEFSEGAPANTVPRGNGISAAPPPAEPLDEGTLAARWDRLGAPQRERAEEQAVLIAAAADAHLLLGKPLAAAFAEASAGARWSAWTLRNAWYGSAGRPGLRDLPRRLWPLALASRRPGRAPVASCDPEAWEAFKTDYLRPEAPPLAHCFRTLQRLAEKRGWTIPKDARALRRRVEREIPRAAVVLARQGREAAARLRPPQVRDRAALRALEAVNADGHRLDLFVRWPDGAVERPMLVAWQDLHSAKVLAWRLDRTESSDGYRLSFADLLREYGIPGRVFLDNGRAGAAKVFTGGTRNRYRFKVKPEDPLGLLTRMVGADRIHWTTPYHGQSKPIERAFRDFATDIARDHRLRGAWTGNRPEAKPENYGSRAVSPQLLSSVVAEGIRQHNARRGRRGLGLDGRSFDEVFAASYERCAAEIPRPTEAQLSRWLLAAEAVVADRESGAVRLFGNRYWSEALAERLGGRTQAQRRVVVRFDPDWLDRPVAVETPDGRLIGRAEPQGTVAVLDTAAAREQAREVNRLRKHAREQLAIHKRMDSRHLDLLLNEAGAGAEEREEDASVVRPVFGGPPGAPDAEAEEAMRRRFDDLALGLDARRRAGSA